MEPKNKINKNIIALIKKERERDSRSFLRKLYDDKAHNTKVLIERFSPIK